MSEPGEDISFSQSQIVWNYIFLIFLIIAIIFNNILLLTTALTQKRLQSQLFIITLGSLAIAQLVGGVLSVPVNIILVKDYHNGARLKFARVVTTFCGTASQLHFVILCVDRLVALLNPIKYGKLKRETFIVAAIVVWILSLVGSALSTVDFKNYSIFISVLFFILPVLVAIVGYTFTYYTLSAIGRDNHTTLIKKEIRVAKAFALMTFIFTLLWIPYVVTIILTDHCDSCDVPSGHTFLFVLYCQMLSLCISSSIYYKGSLDFKLAFKTIWLELRGPFAKPENDYNRDVTVETPSPSNQDKNENSSKQEVTTRVTTRTNLALFLDGAAEEDGQNRRTVQQSHNPSANGSTSRRTGDDVHIVPFDQTRFFGAAGQEDFVDGGDGGMRDDEGDYEGMPSSLSFHDIDIVPYDQNC